ncbi:hypothetical protein NMG60_11000946 [Bertholletia excelsa]
MSFYFGLIFGVAVGIGLMFVYARYAKVRAKHRQELATTMAAFSRMTVQDARKILPAELYPPWVVFSQRQKLNWLNAQLAKVWPYVNEAASELIRNSVEPVLEQYRPAVISSLKFSKLTLGTVAPQFTGVSIVEDDAMGVTMELEMQWDGNPKIVIDVKTKVGVVLPIEVKNIQFTGLFRLIFKPLVDQFPCFGAVCYSLREKKHLDFTLKVVGGEISAIPGISTALEEMIRDSIEDSVGWPVRKIIPILPGDYSDLELKPVGTLEVKLVRGKDIEDTDLIGKSDPYAVLFIRPLRDKMKTSKTISNETNPIWNEHFQFMVEDAATQHLTVRVFDDEGIQASQLIGCAQVPLRDLEPGKVKDMWLTLIKDLEKLRDTKPRGQVQLELLYCPFGTESEFINPYDPDFRMTSLEKALKNTINGTDGADSVTQRKKHIFLRGVLSVTIISAEDLPSKDLMGKSDPYVVLKMRKSKQSKRTRVLNDVLNPVWNQTFDFVVEDALHELLTLEIWDHDILGKSKIGQCVMTLTRAMLEREFRDTFHIEGTKSGKLLLYVKWTPQPIFRDN